MAPKGPDASNACLPPASPVYLSVPPLPSPTRGEPCWLDGDVGRLQKDKPIFAYASGKLVVIRSLDSSVPLVNSTLSVLVYRGHQAPVSALKVSPSGAYVASGDTRGKLRIWALDHEEHLCKLDVPVLTGPMRDVSWDFESKRVGIAGERTDAMSECVRALQWDTGVSCGSLGQHTRGRASTVSMKPNRPMRLVTGGTDDYQLHFHSGPPFQRVKVENGVPSEMQHKAALHCVRFNHEGTLVASTGADKSLCLYDGKTLEFHAKVENIHTSPVYMLAWSGDDKHIMTASGDGTCKLFAVDGKSLSEAHTWNCVDLQGAKTTGDGKIPKGCMQLGCAFIQGTQPVSVGLNGHLCVLPMPGSSSKVQVITGHIAPIDDMAVDVSRHIMYTADTDGIVCQWDLKTGLPTGRLLPPKGEKDDDWYHQLHGGAAISGLTIVPGTNTLLTVGWDDKVYCTNAKGAVDPNPLALPAQPQAIASGTNVSAIITVQALVIMNKGSIAHTMKYEGNYQGLSACVTKDDKTIYVGCDDCKIRVVDAAKGTIQHVIEGGHLKPVHAVVLSNDGSKLASADVRDVCVWEAKGSYKSIIGKSKWCFHLQRITTLAWSPDDKIVASGGMDDSIYLWCLDKPMRRVHYPYAHRGGVVGIAFLNGLKQMVSVGSDSVVHYWNVQDDVAKKFA